MALSLQDMAKRPKKTQALAQKKKTTKTTRPTLDVADLINRGVFESAVPKVEPPPRILGSAGAPVDVIPELFQQSHPTISKVANIALKPIDFLAINPFTKRVAQAANETRFIYEDPNKADVGSAGLNIAADLTGGMLGFLTGGELSAGGKAFDLGVQGLRGVTSRFPSLPTLAGKISPRLAPAAAKAAPYLASGAELGAGGLAYEGIKAGSIGESFTPEDAAKVGFENLLAGIIFRGAGNAASKLRGNLSKRAQEEIFDTGRDLGEQITSQRINTRPRSGGSVETEIPFGTQVYLNRYVESAPRSGGAVKTKLPPKPVSPKFLSKPARSGGTVETEIPPGVNMPRQQFPLQTGRKPSVPSLYKQRFDFQNAVKPAQVKQAIEKIPKTEGTGKPPDPATPQGKLYQATGINIAEKAKAWTDKAKILLGRDTQERNFEKVMGKDAPEMIKTFLDPVHKSEADRIRWLNKERGELASLGIKARSKESELVQKYGEGVITEEQLKAMRPKDWQKIKNASEIIRKKYDQYLDDLNVVLKRNGYDPIPKRQDYFRHFEDVTGLFEQYGIPRRKLEDLPTDINGLSADFRPGKTFFANALRRKGNKTTYDAITGIDGYLNGASRVMFQTDNIQRLRSLEKSLRREFEGSNHLSNFVADLTEYTNVLAGKKAMFDRAAESVIGRSIYTVLDWARRRTGANMIGMNISSALTQYIPLTQSLATTSKPAMAKALKDTIANTVRNDGFIAKSDFLTRRIGSDPLSLNLWDKGAQKASWLFRAIDSFASQTIVRGKYYEGIGKGLSPEQAMKQADDWAARIMADRSLGAMPTLFNSRTLGLFTQFQLEVNNQISFLLRDIPASKETKIGVAAAVTQLMLYGYLFNNLIEKATGFRPALDPIGVAEKAYEDYSNPRLGKDRATANLVKNIGNQLPFTSTFTGGRIPIGAALPNPVAAVTDESTWGKELQKPLTYILPPFGGGQVKKTVTGLIAGSEGGVYKDGKLKYPVTPGPQLYLFGPNSTPEAREYYRQNRAMLSEGQTQQVKNAGPAGRQEYDSIMKQRALDNIKRKMSAVNNDTRLTEKEKVRRLAELREMENKILRGGK